MAWVEFPMEARRGVHNRSHVLIDCCCWLVFSVKPARFFFMFVCVWLRVIALPCSLKCKKNRPTLSVSKKRSKTDAGYPNFELSWAIALIIWRRKSPCSQVKVPRFYRCLPSVSDFCLASSSRHVDPERPALARSGPVLCIHAYVHTYART